MLRALIEIGRVINLPCREHSILISREADGDLPLATRVGLRLHFVLCAPCRHFAKQIRFFKRAARRLPDAAARRALVASRMPHDVRRRLLRSLGGRWRPGTRD